MGSEGRRSRNDDNLFLWVRDVGQRCVVNREVQKVEIRARILKNAERLVTQVKNKNKNEKKIKAYPHLHHFDQVHVGSFVVLLAVTGVFHNREDELADVSDQGQHVHVRGCWPYTADV